MQKLFTFSLLLLCLFRTATAQIVINEVCPDPGINDGTGGEWIELYNAGASAVDISCWRISDGQFVITIPNGTMLSANSFLLVGNSAKMCCSNCDFPSLHTFLGSNYLDLNSCRCLTGNGVTDNGNSSLSQYGDRLVLFNQNNARVDGVFWASGRNAAHADSSISASGNSIGACTNVVCTVPDTANSLYTDLKGEIMGCNSSYTRASDGGAWSANGSFPGKQNSLFSTDWPTPGFKNTYADYSNSLPFRFYVNNSAVSNNSTKFICNSDSVSLKVEVYNWQNISSTLLQADSNLGSFCKIGNSYFNWTYARNNSNGITTLTKNFLPSTGTTAVSMQIEDFTPSCCGSPSYTSTNECYERVSVNIIKTTAIVFNDSVITCPTDNPVGQINANSFFTGGSPTFNFVLKDNGSTISSNNSGIFQLSTSLAGPISIEITDGASCTGVRTMSINNNCRQVPLCPTIALGSTSTASGNKCPGDQISLCIDSASAVNLPRGGTIEWYKGSTAGFDPYSTGEKIGTVSIPLYTGRVVINEMMINAAGGSSPCVGGDTCDGSGGANNGEWIELFGRPGTNIGCWVLTDGGVGSDFTITIPSGTTIPSDGYFVIGTNNNKHVNVDLNIATCNCMNDSMKFVLGNSNDALVLLDNNNNVMDTIKWGTDNAPDGVANTKTVSGCTNNNPPAVTITTSTSVGSDGNSNFRSNDAGNTWTSGTKTMGTKNSSSLAPTSVPCFSYTLADSLCNAGTRYFKAIVKPIDNSCSTANATTASRNYTVTCPVANLTSNGITCSPDSGSITITPVSPSVLADFTGYTLDIYKNGILYKNDTAFSAIYKFAVTGDYQIFDLKKSGSCNGVVNNTGEISILVPSISNFPTTNYICQNENYDLNNLLSCLSPDQGSPSGGVYEWHADNSGSIGATLASSTISGPANGSSTDYWLRYWANSGCSVDKKVTITGQKKALVGLQNCTGTVADFYALDNSLNGTNITYEVIQMSPSGTFPANQTTSNNLVSFNFPSGTNYATIQSYLTGSSCGSASGCANQTSIDLVGCSALPVAIISFTGKEADGKMLLNWQTSSEINIKEYRLEKLIEANKWKLLSTIAANNNSNAQQSYDVIDVDLKKGKNYYRLKTTDLDGKIIEIGRLDFNFDDDVKSEPRLFPIPASNSLSFENFFDGAKNGVIEISDLTGKQLVSLRTSTSAGTIDVSILPNGVFIASFISQDKIISKRIEINR